MASPQHFADPDRRVLPFRPRRSADFVARSPDRLLAGSPVADLSRFEVAREPDDFASRMAANVAALAFTVALTAAGIWLAISIADLRTKQDCVLTGRRDCAPIQPLRLRGGPAPAAAGFVPAG